MSNRDMMTGNVPRALISFAIPLILTGLLQQLYVIVDSLIVGNYLGELALASVGCANPVNNVFIFFITGLVSGCTILISHSFGRKDTERIGKIITTFLMFLTIAGIVFAGIAVVCHRQLLSLLHTDASLFENASTYLSIILAGIPFVVVYNLCGASLRGVGNSKTPLYALIVSSIANVVLDFLFIAVLKTGIAGAAIATLIAHILSALFLLLALRKALNRMNFRPTFKAVDPALFNEGVRLSLPIVLQSTAASFGTLLLQNVMNSFGAGVVAAITTCYKIDTLIILPIRNAAMAVTIFTGQNVGAENRARAREGLKYGLMMMIGYSLVATVVIVLLSGWMLSWFGISAGVIAKGREFFTILALFYPVMGLYECFLGYMQGHKDIKFSSACEVLQLVLRIGFSYALMGIVGWKIIAFAEVTSWVITALVCLLRYRVHYAGQTN